MSERTQATKIVAVETLLAPKAVEQIDAYAKENGITRHEAVAYMLEDWLMGHGLLPLDDEGE